MATAGELRAEAARLREFARIATGVEALEVLFEIDALATELERRSRAMGNGGALSGPL
jgi:hypothetical protein